MKIRNLSLRAQWSVLAAVLIMLTQAPIAFAASVTETQKIVASDAALADFFGGDGVAIDGDSLIVGARGDDTGGGTNAGSAYIFTRSGSTWTEQQKLTASDASSNDGFGVSVAISGNTAIVGVPSDTNAGGSSAGSAFIFTRSGSTWTEQQKLTAAVPDAIAQFGRSVAIEGDTAIVGANADDGTAGTSQGAVYVFTRSGTVWTEQAKLTASDAATSDSFGVFVALDGDTLLVGAFADDAGAGFAQGSAYVFTGAGAAWVEQAKLVASDGAAGDEFGIAVALSGDTAIVGAHNDDVAGSNSGSAYIFTRAGSAWTEQAKLNASDVQGADSFGYSVALDGGTAVIGAEDDDDGGSSSGSAYVFTGAGSTWTEEMKLVASDAAGGDELGHSVAIDSGTAVVAGWLNDDGGTNSGSAYIYDVGPDPCAAADLDGSGTVDGSDLAALLAQWGGAGVADLNGDGIVDGADLAALLAVWGPC